VAIKWVFFGFSEIVAIFKFWIYREYGFGVFEHRILRVF